MSVQVDTVYEGDLICKTTHQPSGSILKTDAPVDNGGKGSLFSPTDLVGVALGTCAVTIMGLVAKRNNLDITGTTVAVTKEMVATPVRRIGELKVIITLPKGKNYSETDRMKLEQAAHACPVKQSLHPDIKLVLEFVY